jgi:hypothetical protein
MPQRFLTKEKKEKLIVVIIIIASGPMSWEISVLCLK